MDNIIDNIPIKGPMIEIKSIIKGKSNRFNLVEAITDSQAKMVPKVENLTETVTPDQISIKKRKSTNAENAKTLEEAKLEEEKAACITEEEEGRLKKQLFEDGFQFVSKKVG